MNVPHNLVKIDINEIKPSLVEYIQNEADNGVRVLDVMFLARGRIIAMEDGYTATATVSVNDVLITDNLSCTVDSANNLVKAEIDCKRLQLTGSGVMKVQITVSDGTNILISPQPVLIRLTSDLSQTAQILPDSHSSYSEIVAEIVAARGDYGNLAQALSHLMGFLSSETVDNATETGKVYYTTVGSSKALIVPVSGDSSQVQFRLDRDGKIYARRRSRSSTTVDFPPWGIFEQIGWTSAEIGAMIDSLVDPTLSVQGKAADAKATGEIRTKQNILFNGLNVSFTESIVTPIVTPIYLKSGESVRITVTDKTAGNIFAYIDGHTSSSYAITISTDGVYIFTASFDGYLSLYTPLNPAPTANMLIEYISALSEKLSDVESETKDNTAAISSVNSTIYKTVNLAVEQGDIDTGNNGGNVNSKKSVRTPSFIEKCINITFPETHVARIFAYQGSTFVGCWSGTEFNKDWTKNLYMPSPVNMGEFFARFPDYSFRLTFWAASKTPITPADTPVNAQIEKYADKIPVYTVGAGGDFATFNGALIALANDSSEKIIEVKQGIYNIFEEYGGAEYIASLTDVDSLSWEDVSVIVPPNTTIRGIGNVVLEWNPTDSEIIDQKHAFLYSPLNLCGSCTIENIKIVCSNCRYGIHDECSGLAVFNEIVRKLKNVVVIYNASTYGVKYAYGAGHARRGSYRYENCTFSAHYGDVWSTHNYLSADTLTHATIEFVFCKFINNITNRPGNIRLSSTNANARKDSVYLNGCYAKGISYGSEWSSTDVWQNYSVTSMCSSPLTDTYQGRILEAYREPTTQYLTING